ncbi:MAG TPA: S-layer homology domain-containing protein [Thermoanaerobaculia bacterium]|jgi:hypothetical protein
MRGISVTLVLLPAMLAVSRAAEAKDARPAAFGTTAMTMVQVPAAQCVALAGSDPVLNNNNFLYSSSAPGTFDCYANLPAGSKLVQVGVVAYDASDSGEVNLNVLRCQSLDANEGCSQSGLVATLGTSASPFAGRLVGDLSGLLAIPVDKTNELDVVRVYLTAAGSDLRFREVDFYYQLQVSTPAPGTQTFGDVLPSNLYYKGIEALAASGITGGCGNGNFCPGQYVTRGEIATFFARALGLHFPN